MISRTRGIRREWRCLIQEMGEEATVLDEEKAEMIADTKNC